MEDYSTHIIVHFYIGDEIPRAKDYQKFLVKFCVHWKSIGLNLGLNEDVLKEIEADHRNQHKDCFGLTLNRWLDQDINATWSKLELAITNARRAALGITEMLDTSKEHIMTLCLHILLCKKCSRYKVFEILKIIVCKFSVPIGG